VKYNEDDIKVSDGKLYTNKMKIVWGSGAKLIMEPTLSRNIVLCVRQQWECAENNSHDPIEASHYE